MKSNIGLVFVVNSEKTFGRFVKEFAGEEEMTVVLLNSYDRAPNFFRLSSIFEVLLLGHEINNE